MFWVWVKRSLPLIYWAAAETDVFIAKVRGARGSDLIVRKTRLKSEDTSGTSVMSAEAMKFITKVWEWC